MTDLSQALEFHRRRHNLGRLGCYLMLAALAALLVAADSIPVWLQVAAGVGVLAALFGLVEFMGTQRRWIEAAGYRLDGSPRL